MIIIKTLTITLLITVAMCNNSIAVDPDNEFNSSEMRYFTVEEADKLLPDVEKCMNALIRVKDGNSKINQEKSPVNTDNTKYNLLEINSMIKGLKDSGVIIRHMKVGLVDFPHLRDGRVVYLCWQAGENKIRYWHEINGGKAGRKPLYF